MALAGMLYRSYGPVLAGLHPELTPNASAAVDVGHPRSFRLQIVMPFSAMASAGCR
jgi:hypothetical protein